VRQAAAVDTALVPWIDQESTTPVEYAVAVDRYLADAGLGSSSRRVYRISLSSWAWALVDRVPPPGARRRGATPPVVPLALLDDQAAVGKLCRAFAVRSAQADVRTVNRELSALRSAVAWWQERGWLSMDATAGLRHLGVHPALPALTHAQVVALFRTAASLREQAFWHLLYDSAAPAEQVLGLDAGAVDLARRCSKSGELPLRWSPVTSQLLGWLLAGRGCGPAFLTDRRAPAHGSGVCPVTGRARMSYRRAAEIFTTSTQPLDPAGRGWTLRQLQHARS
jgi:hypothetical protein